MVMQNTKLLISFFVCCFSICALAQPNNLRSIQTKVVPNLNPAYPVKTINLVQEKVVILDFFVTTCSHCQQHAPHMATLTKKYGSKLLIVSFAADGSRDPEGLKNYLSKFGVINPVTNMTNDQLMQLMGPNKDVPQMFIYSKGILQKQIIGWNNEQQTLLENWLKSLLPQATKKRR